MAEHRSANKGRLTHGRSRISLGDRSRNILGRYFNGYLAIGLSCAVWNLQHWTQASSLYTCMCTHVDVQYACTYVLCMYERLPRQKSNICFDLEILNTCTFHVTASAEEPVNKTCGVR